MSGLQDPAEKPGEEDAGFDAIRARIDASNLSPQTFLATDYLNHFNEIVMTLEMIPDMPELMEEAKAWTPKSYQDHFRDSTIADRDLVIEAYEYVPDRYKKPFETTIGQINKLIGTSVERLERDLERGNSGLLRENAVALSRIIQRLMDTAGAIIHGSEKTLDQGDVDALLGD